MEIDFVGVFIYLFIGHLLAYKLMQDIQKDGPIQSRFWRIAIYEIISFFWLPIYAGFLCVIWAIWFFVAVVGIIFFPINTLYKKIINNPA